MMNERDKFEAWFNTLHDCYKDDLELNKMVGIWAYKGFVAGWESCLTESTKLCSDLIAENAGLKNRCDSLAERITELDGMLGKRNLHKEAEYLERLKVAEDALEDVLLSGLLDGSYNIHSETRMQVNEALYKIRGRI